MFLQQLKHFLKHWIMIKSWNWVDHFVNYHLTSWSSKKVYESTFVQIKNIDIHQFWFPHHVITLSHAPKILNIWHIYTQLKHLFDETWPCVYLLKVKSFSWIKLGLTKKILYLKLLIDEKRSSNPLSKNTQYIHIYIFIYITNAYV